MQMVSGALGSLGFRVSQRVRSTALHKVVGGVGAWVEVPTPPTQTMTLSGLGFPTPPNPLARGADTTNKRLRAILMLRFRWV